MYLESLTLGRRMDCALLRAVITSATGADRSVSKSKSTSTNNLDPASRDEILKAISKYEGAIVLVTHDEGAVLALNPERVLLMPDGDEDLWNDGYLELVAEE